MTTQEIANRLVQMCSSGDYMGAIKALYSPDIVSVEPYAAPGQEAEMRGLDAVLGKGEYFTQNHEIHSSSVEGPLVAGSHFAVTFKLDVTHKPDGRRMNIEEVAVYEVRDGKIVREQFFYGM